MNAKIYIIRIHSTDHNERISEIASAVMTCIKSSEGRKRICFLDEESYGKEFTSQIMQQIPNADFHYTNGNWTLPPQRSNGPEAGFPDEAFDAVIAVCRPERLDGLVRTVSHCFVGPPPVFAALPGSSSASSTQIEEVPVSFGPPNPIIALLYPGAGSARFSPVFNCLMKYHNRNYWAMPPPCFYRRFIDQYVDTENRIGPPSFGGNLISQEIIDAACLDLCHYIPDYYQWTSIHNPVSVSMLGSLENIRIIYLYRDPRDIVNSLYHRLAFDGVKEDFGDFQKQTKEEVFLNLFQGMDYINSRRNYCMRWPSLSEMAKEFVRIKNYKNIYGVTYEDIRYDPRKTYRLLLKWLGMDTISLLPPLSDKALDQAIYQGTFEAQSGGAVHEGEGDGQSTFRASNGKVTAMRKGVAGDWKNNFSLKVKNVVKELIGDALIELEYESDKDW